MKTKYIAIVAVLTAGLSVVHAAAPATRPSTRPATRPAATRPAEQADAGETFDRAADEVRRRLAESLDELSRLRERVVAEKLPLSRKLNELEDELVRAREEYKDASRRLDSTTLELGILRTEIKSREEESTYLSNLLGEYVRNFESRLHIAEVQRYRAPLEEAKLALENTALTRQEVFEAQTDLVAASLDRLEDGLSGARFEGSAADADGLLKEGTFVLVGPAGIFRSEDGESVGAVEQRLGSLEPAVVAFHDPADEAAAESVVTEGAGSFPVDPTLGNAHKVESTEETVWQHIRKGGPVMVPIMILAAAAMLMALYKWIRLSFVRKPSQKRITELLKAIAQRDVAAVRRIVDRIRGPVGSMLAVGVEHIREPRELMEEVMYEKVLSTRLKLQRLLPFIALSASAAPLLGLLGTVTGIINTFKLITVFGSGDVKTLSGGISEALITTEFGLIVAIPSLLLYAFLSRKAKSIVDQMEKTGVAFVNQVCKSRSAGGPDGGSDGNAPAEPAPEKTGRTDVRDRDRDPVMQEA